MKNFSWYLLVLVCLVTSLYLGFSYLQSQLVFGFDQARDGFEAYAIWHNHDLKILGPSTDIPGVFHGVLWYYFLAAVYFLGKSISVGAIISFVVFFLSVPLLALLTQKLFKDRALTCLAVSLYALSPLFQAFGRWLSNPTLALLVTPVLLLFLWDYLSQPKKLSALFVGLLVGFLIQTDFAYVIMIATLPAYIWFFRKKITLSHIIVFCLGLLLSVSSFILADLKFGGQTLTGLLRFFVKAGSSSNASAALLTLFDRMFEILSLTVLPWPKLAAMLLIFLMGVKLYKGGFRPQKKPTVFLGIWLFGFVIMQVVSSAVSGSAHILATFIFPVTILFAYFLKSSRLVPVVALIFLSQVMTVRQWAAQNYSPLSVQKGMSFSFEKEAIDYTYKESQGKPFIINSVTNPLFVNTLWAYLYEFYGQEKYGYLPLWGGRDQAGLLGNLQSQPFGENRRYLIIEDLSGISEFWYDKAVYEEDKVSDLVEEKSFGRIRIQKRVFHPDKGPIPLPVTLQRVTPDLLK